MDKGAMKDMMTTTFLMNSENPLYNFILLQLIEQLTKFLNKFFISFCEYCNNWLDSKGDTLMPSALTGEKEKSASITLERIYSNSEIRESKDIDGILFHISNKYNIKSLFFNGQYSDYLINFYEEFSLTKSINCKLTRVDIKDNTIQKMRFEIYSYTDDMAGLRKFIKDCNETYTRNNMNKLGTDKYFFDQTQSAFSNDQKKLQFTKNKFETNRTFDNIFFTDKEVFVNRINLFKDHPEWYDRRGIPYTMGFLLHGEPGCGKTSSIKALAKHMNRHIINIQSDKIKTHEQLKSLFYDETLYVFNGVNSESFIIPIAERLFVFEDVDCMGDLLLDREIHNIPDKSFKKSAKTPEDLNEKASLPEDPLTLSGLLNILDGTLEIPGRIIILTSNYPELLDRALIRPGRIDMIIKLGKATHAIMSDLYQLYYETEISGDILLKLPEDKWTPAEISKIFFNFINDSDAAISEIINGESDTFRKARETKIKEVELIEQEAEQEKLAEAIQMAEIITNQNPEDEEIGLNLISKDKPMDVKQHIESKITDSLLFSEPSNSNLGSSEFAAF